MKGFGSLGVEALDQALQVLMNLLRRGHPIGIISHVSDLKESLSVLLLPKRRVLYGCYSAEVTVSPPASG
jgi:DNA repair exonuclease SbcCD ATPase subunit